MPHSLRRVGFIATVGLLLGSVTVTSHAGPKPTSKLPTSPTSPTSPTPTTPTSPTPTTPILPQPSGPTPNGPTLPPPELAVDNWGFELGLKGWEKTGTAFDEQPTWGDNVVASRVLNGSTSLAMPLGGDYWKDVSFPIGHRGMRWIGTYEKRSRQTDPAGRTAGDGPTGTLTSKPFTTDKRFITFLVGGGNDGTRLKVELLQKISSPKGIKFSDGTYRVVSGTAKTGRNHELMRREWWDVSALRGQTLRIRIVDNHTGGYGHINVDDFEFQNDNPSTARVTIGKRTIKRLRPFQVRRGDASTLSMVDWDAPVWGLADLHTHPMSHLGFGKKLMYGDPDGPMDKALANCNCTHGGWGVDNGCGNYVRMAVVTMTDGMYKYTADLDHPHQGMPGLRHWPHYTSITHQQMRWEWIKRAHEGGLRVMVALAVNNHLLAEALDGDGPRDDKRSANAQIRFMKQFVGRHRDFMEIAYGPDDLRDIVRRGKLAVILGIEVDNIGNFNFANVAATEGAIRAEVKRLHQQGIRYIFPVHVTDNQFGGAAVYEDMFNFANRFSSVQPLPPALGALVPGQSFQLEKAPDPLVTKRLSVPLASPWVIGIRGFLEAIERLPSPAGIPMEAFLAGQRDYQVVKHFFLTPDPATEAWALIRSGGHRNKRGLSRKGRVAIEEMMRLGMIVDIDHMSEKTTDKVLEMAEAVPGGYPLVSGHNTFRAMAGPGHGNENMRSEAQAERMVRLGGMMGVGWGYEKNEGHTPSFNDAIRTRGGQAWTSSRVADNCGGSSKRFANQYLFALEKMGGAFVGLGSDINGLVPTPGPRFGPDAQRDGNRCPRTSQRDGVTYAGGTVTATSPGSSSTGSAPATPANEPLAPLDKPNGGRWNVNRDGVANYGLLPDFLQDLSNVGLNARDMTPLMNSAEAIAEVWEKAVRVAPGD